MKQIIIVRKDLNMGIGKLCGQVSHASMAFLSRMIQAATVAHPLHRYSAVDEDHMGLPVAKLYKRNDLSQMAEQAFKRGEMYFYAKPVDEKNPYGELMPCDPSVQYRCEMMIDNDLYEKWLGGIFTKVVCEAKNRNALDKAIRIANELGLKEDKDYFLIKDCCLTELTPEEYDENGVGRTLTCIGFRPLPVEIANQISKKFQLYK